MRVLSSLLGLVALGKILGVGAVTIYTTFTTDASGRPLQPTNTNTATGPAYSGYTGVFSCQDDTISPHTPSTMEMDKTKSRKDSWIKGRYKF